MILFKRVKQRKALLLRSLEVLQMMLEAGVGNVAYVCWVTAEALQLYWNFPGGGVCLLCYIFP